MPQIDLSALNGRDLRQLLDASRRRGDAALSYKILQEMAVRREHPAERGPFMMLRPAAEPHLAAIDLDDPAEAEADDLPPLPAWRPPGHVPGDLAATLPPEPEAPPAASPRQSRRKPQPAETKAAPALAPIEVEPPPPPHEPNRPLSLHADPQPPRDKPPVGKDPGPRLRTVEPKAPRRSGLALVTGFALGIAVGIGLGWWAGGARRVVLPFAAPAAAPIRTAALAIRPAPVPAPRTPSSAGLPADAVADPAGGPLAAELNATPPPLTPAPTPAPTPPPNAQEVAPTADGPAIEPPATAPAPRKAEPETSSAAETAPSAQDRTAPAAATGCAAAATPADRQICGDPQLRRLQRELQQAYAKALEAHQDRALLRQRQLAWRDARNAVSDPAQLAQLYQQRIRKLNAATAAARQQR